MPEAVSAMRGLALPSQPFKDTPLVVTAPRAATSTKSWYSMPAPKVPEATVTGFFMAMPPRFTDRLTLVSFGLRCITTPPRSQQNTGPSTQARRLPAVVSTTQDRHAPTPQAMRLSMDTSQNTPAASAMPATIFMRGSGPQQAT